MYCEISVTLSGKYLHDDEPYTTSGKVSFSTSDPNDVDGTKKNTRDFLNTFIQHLVYAIPKDHFPPFNCICMYHEGKIIAQGDN